MSVLSKLLVPNKVNKWEIEKIELRATIVGGILRAGI